MPLPVQRILIPGLLLLAGTSTADNDLNWVDREEMATFPAVQQRSIPEWCGGIYYNPAVGIPVAGSDTVVQGMVIHRGANGLGVMFLDENTHAVTDLCNRHALHRSTPPVRRTELGAIPA